MTTEEIVDEILQLKGIDKSFPGVHALKEVDFSLGRGEIRGLVGENGAGKSTLMNVLGGVLKPEAGSITINNKQVTIENPAKAEHIGISFIHQELSLFENLDVASNVFFNRIPTKSGLIHNRKLFSETEKILERVGLSHINPKERIRYLQMGQRQLVEIAKCLTRSPKILILDEPTSSLTKREIETLFTIIKGLKNEGVSIIFISHRLDEIYQICDSVTIMRDGQKVSTAKIDQIERSQVVKLMIGRDISEMYTHESSKPGNVLLEVKGFTRKDKFHDISLSIREGEMVGLYGLMGSGRTELVRSIFGLDPVDSGEVFMEGEKIHINKPSQAINSGISLITENRREEGLVTIHSVQSNLILSSLRHFRKTFSMVDTKKENEVTEENIEAFNIKTSSPRKIVKFLSGGNQQKVVIAKWINTQPKVLMLDEPTRGIDVGAKKEVFKLLDDMLSEKVGIFVISSELPELMGVCDRILVIRNGNIVAEFNQDNKSDESILSYAMGAK